MARFFRWRIVLVVSAGLLLGLAACYELWLHSGSGYEEVVSATDYYYTFDPDTILESLARGNTNVFTLAISTPEAIPSSLGKPVRWSADDFYRIAQAFSRFVWGEPLENWNLRGMDFGLFCSDVGVGLQEAHYLLFQVDKTRGRKSRWVRSIYIDPRLDYVKAYQEEYYPDLQNWETIDWTRIIISADEALQIAEMKGGYEVRSRDTYDCDIGIIIASGSMSDGWDVTYYGHYWDVGYSIDPYTGEVMRVRER